MTIILPIIRRLSLVVKMQLHALEEKSLIFAAEAQKSADYRCPECLNIVRLRGGPYRQAHFYHLRNHPSCRQHSKSLAHLGLQIHVKSLIPEAILERRFEEIGRIADVAWEEKKLIFEIQCSPISLEEVQGRNRDYASIGYSVVWILHAGRYNRHLITPAEFFLRQGICFFAEKTKIYDQYEVLRGFRRVHRGPQIGVDITEPKRLTINELGDNNKNPRFLSFYKACLFRLLERLTCI